MTRFPPAQFLSLSTSLLAAIQGIITLNSAPTSSIECAADFARTTTHVTWRTRLAGQLLGCGLDQFCRRPGATAERRSRSEETLHTAFEHRPMNIDPQSRGKAASQN